MIFALFTGDLASSIRMRTNVTFGLYYSLYEWFHPLYLKDKENKFTTQEYVDVSFGTGVNFSVSRFERVLLLGSFLDNNYQKANKV